MKEDWLREGARMAKRPLAESVVDVEGALDRRAHGIMCEKREPACESDISYGRASGRCWLRGEAKTLAAGIDITIRSCWLRHEV